MQNCVIICTLTNKDRDNKSFNSRCICTLLDKYFERKITSLLKTKYFILFKTIIIYLVRALNDIIIYYCIQNVYFLNIDYMFKSTSCLTGFFYISIYILIV